MFNNTRAKVHHPKITSPFVKGQHIFPKDFFYNNENKPNKKSRKEKLYDKINTTFDHCEQPLLESSGEKIKKSDIQLRSNKSFRRANRKYVKLRNFSSKHSRSNMYNSGSYSHSYKAPEK